MLVFWPALIGMLVENKEIDNETRNNIYRRAV